jgi:large subunit ribosomal protein L23
MSIFSRKKKPVKLSKNDSEVIKVAKKTDEKPKAFRQEEKAKITKTKSADLPLVKTRLITKPLLTEKSTGLESYDQYVFVVDARANKSEIKKEIEHLFDINVESVNIINKKRKRRVWRGKVGYSPGLKKAIIKIAKGQKIEILPH